MSKISQSNLFTKEPRGIRNNNPLNLKHTLSPWKGKVGNDGTFEVFSDASFGFRAAYKNIQTWIRRCPSLTLEQLIFLWCPDKTRYSYLSTVCRLTNFLKWRNVSSLDKNDYVALLKAMCFVENGKCPYTDKFILNAIQIK